MSPIHRKTRVTVFISYAHADYESKTFGSRIVDLRERLTKKFRLSPTYEFVEWDDFSILPGQNWRNIITGKLNDCDCGLILVSENLLLSKFIAVVELPALLAANKTCIPVSFGNFDVKHSQGLAEQQIWRLRRPGETPRSFMKCGSEDLKDQFATELFNNIESLIAKNRQGCKADAAPEPVEPEMTKSAIPGKADPALLRKVFADQYGAIKRILEQNTDFRELLFRVFRVPESLDRDEATLHLMVHFNGGFLEVLAKFGAIYEDYDHKPLLEKLASFAMYLAMDAEFAGRLAAAEKPETIQIPPGAEHGIRSMLICWAHNRLYVPLKGDDRSRILNSPLMSPQMRYEEIRQALIAKYKIDPNRKDLDNTLKAKLEADQDFRTPQFHTVSEDEKDLIERIKQPDSPLKDLLLFVKTTDFTINPGIPDNYDQRFEEHYAKLIGLIENPIP